MENFKTQAKSIFSEIKTEFEDLTSKVIVDSGVSFSSEMKKISQEFLDFCSENLELKEYPKIKILEKRPKGITYGVFNAVDNSISIYGKGRGLADVLRTAAHELTHYWQKINNKIPEDLKKRDHKLEAEANAVAGELIYEFGQKNPNVYELGIQSNVVEMSIDETTK